MRQLLRIGIVFGFLAMNGGTIATSVSAQAPPPPPPPPPPARDYFPASWEQYESKEGRFRVRFPGKPKEESSIQETSTGKLNVHSMRYKGLLAYQVSYIDFAKPLDDAATAKQVFQAMRASALEASKEQNSLVVKEKEVSVNGYPGYFLHIEFNGKMVGRLEWVLVSNRVYTITVEGRKSSTNELEGKDDFEKIAMGFINSFEVLSQ